MGMEADLKSADIKSKKYRKKIVDAITLRKTTEIRKLQEIREERILDWTAWWDRHSSNTFKNIPNRDAFLKLIKEKHGNLTKKDVTKAKLRTAGIIHGEQNMRYSNPKKMYISTSKNTKE